MFALVSLASNSFAEGTAAPASSAASAPAGSAASAPPPLPPATAEPSTAVPPPASGTSATVTVEAGASTGTAAAPAPAKAEPAKPEAAKAEAAKAEAPKKDPEEDESPLWTGTTRLASRYYEVGLNIAIGGLMRAPGAESIGLTGVSVFEHHGLISKIGVAALVALGQSNGKYVGSTTTVEGNYVVRRDYYRSLTPEEQAAQAAAVQAAIRGEYTANLTVYSRGLFGLNPGTTQGSGAEFNIGMDIPITTIEQLPVVLTVGLNAASISAPVVWKDAKDLRRELTYSNLGFLARLHIPVTRYADMVVEWHLNALVLNGFDKPLAEGTLHTSPLRVGMYGNITDRAYLKGQLILSGFGFSEGRLGYQAELGVRF